MRIIQKAISDLSLLGLMRNQSAVARLQEKLTSGKELSKPSDSPTGVNSSMALRNEMRAAEQYTRNIADGQGWLGITDSSLQTMVDMTHRVRNLALTAKNTGTMSPAAQTALAAEVKTLREGLLGVANTTIAGRPVFGGVTGGGAAYDAAGNWVGDNAAPVMRRVSATESVRIDISGVEAFGPPGADLFTIVDRIMADVADPAALTTDLDDLDVALDRLLTAVSDIGARQNRIDRADQIVADRTIALKASLSEVEDIDLPKTIMELEMSKVGYQAALAATAKVIQPTLMDFLR